MRSLSVYGCTKYLPVDTSLPLTNRPGKNKCLILAVQRRSNRKRALPSVRTRKKMITAPKQILRMQKKIEVGT